MIRIVKDKFTLKDKAELGYQIGWWLTVLLLRLNPISIIEHEMNERIRDGGFDG